MSDSKADDFRDSFPNCVRCGYSLQGLPPENACPECGLQYDADCEIYRVRNGKQVVAVWCIICANGWMVLRELKHVHLLADPSAMSLWQMVGVLAAIAWFPFVGAAVWILIKRYRLGFMVAVTSEGLILRLPAHRCKLLPWSEIKGAEINDKDKSPSGRLTVTLGMEGARKRMSLGGLYNIFPTREDAEHFVRQVDHRVARAKLASAVVPDESDVV